MKFLVKKILLATFSLLVIFIVILTLFYYYYNKRKHIVIFCKKPTLGYERKILESPLLKPVDNIYRFSYCFFIYLQDYNYRFNSVKPVFVKGSKNNACPAFYLAKNINSGIITINTDKGIKRLSICDIPLRKWVHIAFCVNNGEIDLYRDGKLVKSSVLGGNCKINSQPIILSDKGGFSGLIYKLTYNPKYLNHIEIKHISQDKPPINKKYFLNLLN
jgi:hypothetical protein